MPVRECRYKPGNSISCERERDRISCFLHRFKGLARPHPSDRAAVHNGGVVRAHRRRPATLRVQFRAASSAGAVRGGPEMPSPAAAVPCHARPLEIGQSRSLAAAGVAFGNSVPEQALDPVWEAWAPVIPGPGSFMTQMAIKPRCRYPGMFPLPGLGKWHGKRAVAAKTCGIQGATPRSLGVWRFLGFYGCDVPSVSWWQFWFAVRVRLGAACRGGWGARFHGRGPACAGRSSFLTAGLPGAGSGEAGCEYGDLGFGGDGRLGRGGVQEFRAGFLRPFRVALPSGEVQGVQDGAGGGVRGGGERVQ